MYSFLKQNPKVFFLVLKNKTNHQNKNTQQCLHCYYCDTDKENSIFSPTAFLCLLEILNLPQVPSSLSLDNAMACHLCFSPYFCDVSTLQGRPQNDWPTTDISCKICHANGAELLQTGATCPWRKSKQWSLMCAHKGFHVEDVTSCEIYPAASR